MKELICGGDKNIESFFILKYTNKIINNRNDSEAFLIIKGKINFWLFKIRKGIKQQNIICSFSWEMKKINNKLNYIFIIKYLKQ